MPECFCREHAKSERLWAEEDPRRKSDYLPCPLISEHCGVRPIGQLFLQVKHNKRDEWIIPSWTTPDVFHQSLLEEFEKRNLGGYRTKPATVRFRDGLVSNDYHELTIVGWGGHARPESGIQLLEQCAGCGLRKYSEVQDAQQLIDWSQWSGEDFFFVWPLSRTFITERVADALAVLKVKSYSLRTLDLLEREKIYGKSPALGYQAPPMSRFKPEDIAEKYGRPLGLY